MPSERDQGSHHGVVTTVGNFTLHVRADGSAEITRWCLPDGDPGALTDHILFPAGSLSEIEKRASSICDRYGVR